jgi:cell division protein FtsX
MSLRRKSITFNRIILAGMVNFVRNASLAIAAMAVMVVTLTIVLFSIVTNATFSNTIQQITDKIDISVYLKDEVTTDQKNQLVKQLEHLPNVQSLKYLSKDDALQRYVKQNAGNADLAIFNRRDEIQIMRLLGASTSYIRGPFVVESIIYGILSAVISVLIINGAFAASSGALQASALGLLDINYANEFFTSHYLWLLTLQLGVGIVIGAASSVIATARYLKFKTSK